jgi:hypothetical protein
VRHPGVLVLVFVEAQRTVSLGICAVRTSTLAELGCRLSASDRGIPLVAEANCTRA